MILLQVNPTEHAIMQSILHSSGLDGGAGEPCCVPTKLRGLTVFAIRGRHIITKKFPGMIVEECGCR